MEGTTRFPRADDDRSMGELVNQLSQQTSTLIRQEMRLAQAELRRRASTWGSERACSAARVWWPCTASARSWPPRSWAGTADRAVARSGDRGSGAARGGGAGGTRGTQAGRPRDAAVAGANDREREARRRHGEGESPGHDPAGHRAAAPRDRAHPSRAGRDRRRALSHKADVKAQVRHKAHEARSRPGEGSGRPATSPAEATRRQHQAGGDSPHRCDRSQPEARWVWWRAGRSGGEDHGTLRAQTERHEQCTSRTTPGPRGPTDLRARSWFGVLKRTVKEFREDNLTDWAAALTYYGILSIFPALLVLVSVLGLIGESATPAAARQPRRRSPPAPRRRSSRTRSRTCTAARARRASC